MGRKAKYSFNVKLDIVTHCLSGKTTVYHEAVPLGGINTARIFELISLYQSLDPESLVITSKMLIILPKLRERLFWIILVVPVLTYRFVKNTEFIQRINSVSGF